MAAPLRMPDLGTVEGDVVLVHWLKAEGDAVALGEPLFEVETDKGVSEVESALAGVIEKLVVQAGARAAAGDVIALIRRPGESAGMDQPAAAGAAAAAVPPAPAVPGQPAAPGAPAAFVQPAAPAQPGGAPAPAHEGPRKIAPAVRALAEKWSVDISAVAATGPGGLVTREDVLAARGKARVAGEPAPAAPARAPGDATVAAPRTGGLSRHQASIARAVSLSHREKPTFRVSAAVDMSRAVTQRAQGKSTGAAVSYDAMVVKAAAAAIAEHPVFRVWMRGEQVLEHPDVAVAFAVSVGDDLYAPCVQAADRKGVQEISRDMDGLARKAEGHSLLPADVEGSCFLVSNLGMFPISSFDAIIYPEHSAALAVGVITPTPVADGAGVRVAPLATLTLTVDHRLINGRKAAQFLARVKEILETGAS